MGGQEIGRGARVGARVAATPCGARGARGARAVGSKVAESQPGKVGVPARARPPRTSPLTPDNSLDLRGT